MDAQRAWSAEVEWSFPPTTASIASARNAVSDQLGRRTGTTTVEDIRLLVSELVTNAVVHVGSTCTVTLRTSDTVIRVEVGDADPADAEPAEGEAAPDPEAVSDAEVEASAVPVETGPVRPALHVWSATVENAVAPPRDAYALRLVTGRRCYDRGRALSATPALAGLAAEPVLRANPSDVARIGAERGSVRVTSARGSLVVGIVADARVPAGTARFDLTADGEGPAELIDAAAAVTDLRVESVR